jgi:Na+-transporting NADH:ubiquinone oxidoreductase subunit NqrF
MYSARAIALTTTAVNLQTAMDINKERFTYIFLQAPATNSTNVQFGKQSNIIFVLEPGDKVLLPVGNTKDFWFVAASGTPTVNVGLFQ